MISSKFQGQFPFFYSFMKYNIPYTLFSITVILILHSAYFSTCILYNYVISNPHSYGTWQGMMDSTIIYHQLTIVHMYYSYSCVTSVVQSIKFCSKQTANVCTTRNLDQQVRVNILYYVCMYVCNMIQCMHVNLITGMMLHSTCWIPA